MERNQNEKSLSFWYFIAVLFASTAVFLMIAVGISDFSSYLSSIGESHLVKHNH